jgi:hypothetical protein
MRLFGFILARMAFAGSDNGIKWLRLFLVRDPGKLIASSVTSPHCRWAISSRLAAVKINSLTMFP